MSHKTARYLYMLSKVETMDRSQVVVMNHCHTHAVCHRIYWTLEPRSGRSHGVWGSTWGALLSDVELHWPRNQGAARLVEHQ